MNTASRMETTGAPGKVHVSQETAELLVASGKQKWVTRRTDQVFAKGKGALTTYWFSIQTESNATGSSNVSVESIASDVAPPTRATVAMNRALSPTSDIETDEVESALSKLSSKEQRLVAWNVDMLVKVLKQIMARRSSYRSMPKLTRQQTKEIVPGGTVLDEVKDVLALPQFDAKIMQKEADPMSITVPDQVVSQLMDMVARIAGLYQDNSFHSFEHASHVTMSVAKLLGRIVNPNDVSSKSSSDGNRAEMLHDHTFGTSTAPRKALEI